MKHRISHKKYNGHRVYRYIDPYNPLNLPPYTIRVRYKAGTSPKTYSTGTVKTLVDSDKNIWDITYENNNWGALFGLYLVDYAPSTAVADNLIEVLGANSNGVTEMVSMFGNCSSLTNISSFNTSQVSDMNRMFAGCTKLSSIENFDAINVTNMHSMFRGCSSLTTAPSLSTSSVTDMGYMFANCIALTSVPLYNTPNASSMTEMFEYCYSLSSVPLFETNNVTSFHYMFQNCSSLSGIPLFNTDKVKRMNGMFYKCYGVSNGALALYQQASTQSVPPREHRLTFRDCGTNTQTGSAELSQIPSDWK